jgi:phosphatidylserine/phosphatidylglycerophosphate/cardiolipin synthase-like enzyme
MDGSVVIMDSFNWTWQTVKYNQENIFLYEDKNIAGQYAQEFENFGIVLILLLIKSKLN